MKKISALIITLIYISLFGLDPRYHTYDEIKRELDSLQTLYPEYVHVESIGVSLNENIPIWAVKLSDNASEDEDEPAVMYAGQCHAEEVLGNEITMHMIMDILDHRNINPYKIWLQEIEMWFVPSYNPEGLAVVMDGTDVSFRKNKRDNNNNGIFDFEPQPGDDIDGVDLNRNYGFNWIHGDTLYCTGGEERYDYYRGPAPFSEGETQAIRNLAEKQHFIYSINWHSSRTGNFSEKLFYSFEHAENKKSPDFELAKSVGDKSASLIKTEDGSASYEPSSSKGRKGSAHDWFYQQHGTIQLLIECGTRNLQPDADIVDDTCVRNSLGGYWLLNRAIGYNADGSMLTGHVKDSSTNEPIEAEVIIEEHHASYFAPRMTDEKFGRFFRPLMPGVYTVRVKKKGYKEKVIESVNVNNSMPTNIDITLDKLPESAITGTIKKNGTPVTGKIEVLGDYSEIINADGGNFSFDWFRGNISVIVTSDGCSPMMYTGYIKEGTNNMSFDLSSETLSFEESFDNLSAFEINGDWAVRTDNGRTFADDSPKKFYSDSKSVNMKTVNSFTVDSEGAILELSHKYYVEHDNDLCKVQLSENGSDWNTVETFTGISDGFIKSYISLEEYKGKSVYLRFVLSSDESLNDPGWKIDHIKVHADNGTGIEDFASLPNKTELHTNYPNPFNPSTTIAFSISGAQTDVNLSVYNVNGQLIRTLVNSSRRAGHYSVKFDGKNNNGQSVSSGLYYYVLKTSNNKISKKMILSK